MLGINVKISNYNLSNLKLYNNNLEPIVFKYLDYKIYVVGKIFERDLIIKTKIVNCIFKSSFKNLLEFNGEYAILIVNKKKNFFLVGNSKNSYIPVFFYQNKNTIEIKPSIFHFKNSFFKKLNKKRIYEYLIFNGRSFSNETFIKDLKILEPGSIILRNKQKNSCIKIGVFKFISSNLSFSKTITQVTKGLTEAIKIRLDSVKNNVSFGLSGGLDSRLLLALVDKKNFKKIKVHTVGSRESYEKFIAKKISKIIGITHNLINIPINDYYTLAKDSVMESGFNTVFKMGVNKKYYNLIKRKDNSNFFIFSNALDVLIASSYSNNKLLKIKSRKKYIDWFKKEHLLFNYFEIKKLFINKLIPEKKIYSNFNKFLNHYNFKKNNTIDINDAFTYETRIKRWHNYTLTIFSRISNLLIPTYDSNFLKICSSIPYKYRINDSIRKAIIKKIDSKLIDIPTSNSIENYMLKKNIHHIRYYDSNLGYNMKTENKVDNLYNKLKRKILKTKGFNFINFTFIEAIINDHKKNVPDNTRKILLVLTLLISLILIFKKNNQIK